MQFHRFRQYQVFPHISQMQQIPVRYNYKNTGRPADGVGLRSTNGRKIYQSCYLFTPNAPLYPFGYGLSYTEFSFDSLEILTPEVALGESVRIRARVSNVGNREGAAVAQLYMRDLVASTTRPVRELKGFEKLFLKKGESRFVEFVLTPDDMAFCRKDMEFAQEPGEFKVWIGDSSDAALEGVFVVK